MMMIMRRILFSTSLEILQGNKGLMEGDKVVMACPPPPTRENPALCYFRELESISFSNKTRVNMFATCQINSHCR